MFTRTLFFTAVAVAVAAQESCTDGQCRANTAGYDLCGSGTWFTFTTPYYACEDGRILPVTPGEEPSPATSATSDTTPYATSDFSTSSTIPAASPTTSVNQPYPTSSANQPPPTSSANQPPPTFTASVSPTPQTRSTASSSAISSSTQSSVGNAQTRAPGSSGSPGQTGYSACENIPNSIRTSANGAGRASYQPGGKMSSYYQADATSTFRCDGVAYPSNGYFAAVWTQYEAGLPSQPAPLNCGDMLTITNPVNGKIADVLIIDRCQSCVGVGNDPNDPTTPLDLVNGATIDLGPPVWNYLFDGADPDVFDIEYSGNPITGWNTAPMALPSHPTSQECTG